MPSLPGPPSAPAGDALTVRTAAAAALFAHPGRRRILFAFARERSLGEVTAQVRMPMNLLHYHVQRMLRAGLLQRRAKVQRAGRAIQLYRAAATAFFVPSALMRVRPDERLRRDLDAALDRARPQTDGYLFSAGADGRIEMRQVGEPGRGAIGEIWRRVCLDEAAARDLLARIGALIDEVRRAAGSRGRSYLIHAALAPDSGAPKSTAGVRLNGFPELLPRRW